MTVSKVSSIQPIAKAYIGLSALKGSSTKRFLIFLLVHTELPARLSVLHSRTAVEREFNTGQIDLVSEALG